MQPSFQSRVFNMTLYPDNLEHPPVTNQIVVRCRKDDVRAYRELYGGVFQSNVQHLPENDGAFGRCGRCVAGSLCTGVQEPGQAGHGQQSYRLDQKDRGEPLPQLSPQKRRLYFEEVGEAEFEEEERVDESEHTMTVAAVKEAIGQLPDGCRTVPIFTCSKSIRTAGIATLLGISESTVKTQYMRAKREG